jgi:CheY-like chemotaxis protein
LRQQKVSRIESWIRFESEAFQQVNCEPRTVRPVLRDSRTLPLSALRLTTTVATSANARESRIVIVVDDDASVAKSTCRFIRSLGMRGEAFFSGADLLNSGRVSDASCLILDVRMPNIDGFELHRRLKDIRPSIPVIFFSAHAGKEEEEKALRSGAVAFLRKPVHRDDLLRVIRMALEKAS